MIMDAAKHGVEIPNNVPGPTSSFTDFHAGPEIQATEPETGLSRLDQRNLLRIFCLQCQSYGQVREVGEEARFSVESFAMSILSAPQTEAERYYLQTHAPIIRDLEDDRRQFHEALRYSSEIER